MGQRVPLTVTMPPRSIAQKYTGGGTLGAAMFRRWLKAHYC